MQRYQHARASLCVAKTSDRRGALGPPDLSYHSYPHRLLFKGNSDHIPAYKLALALIRDVFCNNLENSTALVLPSRKEPWGLVVNEALGYGCPVVVSEVCGCIPELVIAGVTGFIFPAGDVAALRDSMLKVISLSNNRLETAKRCMEVISHYTPERAAAEILKGCNQILASR